jgi:hypothetical protein
VYEQNTGLHLFQNILVHFTDEKKTIKGANSVVMEGNVMDDLRNVFTVRKSSKSLKTYLNCSEGSHCFEVKDGDEIFYRGDSFEKATQVYENLTSQAPL